MVTWARYGCSFKTMPIPTPNTASTDTGDTALHVASQCGHVELAQLLLELSADPNTATIDTGDTALILASQEGHVEVLRMLLQNNADPTQRRPIQGTRR